MASILRPRTANTDEAATPERLFRRDHGRGRPAPRPPRALAARRDSLLADQRRHRARGHGAGQELAGRQGPGAARPRAQGRRVGARRRGSARPYAKVRGRLGRAATRSATALAGVVLEALRGRARRSRRPGRLRRGRARRRTPRSSPCPRNLCARVPEGVPAEDAAYGTVAAIALHGVRLAEAGLGDVVAVVGPRPRRPAGAGARRGGRRVPLGVDPDPGRAELARRGGPHRRHRSAPSSRPRPAGSARAGAPTRCWSPPPAVDSAPLAHRHRRRRASARSSAWSATCRSSRRARRCSRRSCGSSSRAPTGPAATTPPTRSGGIDYPAGYVRWTEGRNLEEVLRLIAAGRLRPSRLTTHTFDLDEGERRLRAARRRRALGGHPPALSRDRPRRGPRDLGPPTPAPWPPGGGQSRATACASGSSARAPSRAACCCRSSPATRTSPRSPPPPGRRPRPRRSASGRRSPPRTPPRCSRLPTSTRWSSRRATTRTPSTPRAALEAGKHVFVEKPLALDEAELGDGGGGRAGLGRGPDGRLQPPLRAARAASCARRWAVAGRWSSPTGSTPGRLPALALDPRPAGRRRADRRRGLPLRRLRVLPLPGALAVGASAGGVGGGSEPREDNVVATRRLRRRLGRLDRLHRARRRRAAQGARRGARRGRRRRARRLPPARPPPRRAPPRRARAAATRVTPPSSPPSSTRAGPGGSPGRSPTCWRSCARHLTSATRCARRPRPPADSVRVLVVSQYFPPEPGATQNRLGAFVDGLVERGASGDGGVRAAQPSRRASSIRASAAGPW